MIRLMKKVECDLATFVNWRAKNSQKKIFLSIFFVLVHVFNEVEKN